MSDLISALAGDLVSLAQLPGGNVAGVAIKGLFRKRLEGAREILLQALARGEIRPGRVSDEDGAAMIYRYLRAAQEGTSRVNLRLLAQVIAGQVQVGVITADEFLYYADLLSPLRRDEILLLGTLYRYWHANVSPTHEENSEGTRGKATMDAMRSQLVPRVFETEPELAAVSASLMRTGLLLTIATYGGTYYGPSPLLERLMGVVDLEAAAASDAL